VRGRRTRSGIGANFGGHKAFRALAITHQHHLAGAEFGETEAPQGLHVHEDVGGALAAGEEAEAAQTIEPFHPGAFEAARRRDGNVGARRQLRRMDRRRLVHRDDAEALQPFLPLVHLGNDARAFIGGLESIAAETRDVQQHVGHAVIRHDEAVTFGDVEPLDEAGDLDQPHRRFFGGSLNTRLLLVQCELRPQPIRSH